MKKEADLIYPYNNEQNKNIKNQIRYNILQKINTYQCLRPPTVGTRATITVVFFGIRVSSDSYTIIKDKKCNTYNLNN